MEARDDFPMRYSRAFKKVLCASLLERLDGGDYLTVTHTVNPRSTKSLVNAGRPQTVYTFHNVAGLTVFQLTFFKHPDGITNVASILAIVGELKCAYYGDDWNYPWEEYDGRKYHYRMTNETSVFKPAQELQYLKMPVYDVKIIKVPTGLNEAKRAQFLGQTDKKLSPLATMINDKDWKDQVYPLTAVATSVDMTTPVGTAAVRAFIGEFRGEIFDAIVDHDQLLEVFKGRTKTFVALDTGAVSTVPMTAVQVCFAEDPETLPQLLNAEGNLQTTDDRFDEDPSTYGLELSINGNTLCKVHTDTPKAELFRALEHDDAAEIMVTYAAELNIDPYQMQDDDDDATLFAKIGRHTRALTRDQAPPPPPRPTATEDDAAFNRAFSQRIAIRAANPEQPPPPPPPPGMRKFNMLLSFCDA